MARPATNRLEITGKRYGRLVVVCENGRAPSGQILWECACDCGGVAVTTSTKLKSGHTQSCGCYARLRRSEANIKHGHMTRVNRHPLVNVWENMKRRCSDPKNRDFQRYGGRGIFVCERWVLGDGNISAFQCFLNDMGPRPGPEFSIDRIDQNGPYCPENCRWADAKTQARNRRTTRLVEHKGGNISLAEFCEKTGVNYSAAATRLHRGQSIIGMRGNE